MNSHDIEQEFSTTFAEDYSTNKSTPKLALYMTPYCPFCIFVKSAISSLDMDVEMRNIYEQEYFEDLMAARKRATVPVLRITEGSKESWLPESKDIVKYLTELKQAS